MSQENVDLVRGHYEAFDRGDIEAALEMMDDAIEFSVAEDSVFYRGAPFRGRQEVADQVFRRLGAEWDSFTVKRSALYDAGDTVIMVGRYGGTFKATGRSTSAQVVHIWTIRDGKLAKFQQYVNTREVRAVVESETKLATSNPPSVNLEPRTGRRPTVEAEFQSHSQPMSET